MARDVFPMTHMSWIGSRLRDGDAGRREVGRHLMSVYAEPLRVYYLGTRSRWLGEPDEVVDGFFADRLARPGFVAEWERSGMRLRRWLMNAFGFYLKELARRRRRDAVRDPGPGNEPGFEGDAERAIDRAFTVSVVRHALDETRRACEVERLEPHWRVFEAHFCRDVPYAAIGAELGVEPARCMVMARTVRSRFRAALCAALEADGAGDRTDAEIMDLLGGDGP